MASIEPHHRDFHIQGVDRVAMLPWKVKCLGSGHGCPKRNCVIPKGMVSSLWYCGDLEGPRATTGVTGGGEETLLSKVRLCGMGVPPNKALDTSKSLHLIIGYLLRVDYGDLEFQVDWLK